ncbi:hypothetical protein B296_00028713, partial [Ensete ventricosum]
MEDTSTTPILLLFFFFLLFLFFFFPFSPSIDRRWPKSIVDGQFWRYRPVAGSPHAGNLVDRYIPPVWAIHIGMENLHYDNIWSSLMTNHVNIYDLGARFALPSGKALYRAVRTDLPIDRFADRLLPGSTAEIDSRRSIEGERRSERRRETKKREKPIPRTLLFPRSPVRSVAHGQFFSPRKEKNST